MLPTIRKTVIQVPNLMPRLRFCALLLLCYVCTNVHCQTNDDLKGTPENQLTSAERTFGLVQFWSETKYNFVYFDQVPDLNWDAALQEYIPLIQNVKNDEEYYRLLEKFCALLKNVNTTIQRPKLLANYWARPQLGIELLENVPVVVNRSKEVGEKVPLGAQIISINEVPLETHLVENVYPYITAGGEQVQRRWAAHDVLKGPTGSEVKFTFKTLDGKHGSAILQRKQRTEETIWKVPRTEWFSLTFEMLKGRVGLLTVNSFADAKVTEEFLKYLPKIKKCKKLVIDLRKNMSGNSEVAYDILKYFTKTPLLTSSWRTRKHRAANWALGSALAKNDPETLNEHDNYNEQMYLGEIWHVIPSDTIQPALKPITDIPIAVLISNYTASGAEKFLVAADVLENFVFIGEPSFGDTPQPPILSLPGGGSASISTKRDTYPNGRVFVGSGVNVDINIPSSINDYFDERDIVLAKALEVLK